MVHAWCLPTTCASGHTLARSSPHAPPLPPGAQVVVVSPSTMITLGPLLRFEPLLAIGGLALISALHYRNVPGSILVGVAATTATYCAVKNTWPHE